MADIGDRASDLEQLFNESSLYLAQKLANSKTRALEPRGTCYYCETKSKLPEQLFCDKECAEGHEALKRAQARNGRGED